MRATTQERRAARVWDVVRPARPSGMAGVTMAGFRDLGRTPAGLRLIPHPAVTVAFVFGAGSVTVDDAGRQRSGSLVAGLGLGFGAVRVRRAAGFEAVQVRLSPALARAAFGGALADLDGGVATLEDLWGPEAARIGERLGDASSWAERFAMTEAAVARRCGAGPAVDPEVSWAWERIRRGQGRVRVEGLADELGWSRKRLWSRFRAQIGLAPKRAASLVRFDRAAHGLVAGLGAARVAADGGYADQSHLHRDVVAFAGVTPRTVGSEPFLTVDRLAWESGG